MYGKDKRNKRHAVSIPPAICGVFRLVRRRVTTRFYVALRGALSKFPHFFRRRGGSCKPLHLRAGEGMSEVPLDEENRVDLGIDPHSERKSAKPRQTRAYSRSGAGLLHGGQFGSY